MLYLLCKIVMERSFSFFFTLLIRLLLPLNVALPQMKNEKEQLQKLESQRGARQTQKKTKKTKKAGKARRGKNEMETLTIIGTSQRSDGWFDENRNTPPTFLLSERKLTGMLMYYKYW